MADDAIQRAIAYAKQNKKRICRKLTDTNVFLPDPTPISIFMAGSPGAGKTEFSKTFIERFEQEQTRRVVRIDADELRGEFVDYHGNNSSDFQAAISILVDRILDTVISNKQTFLLDGTFWDYGKAVKNINRSIDHDRTVFIFYLYQDPTIAWRFTQLRERVEGRNIPKTAFIDQFLGAKKTVKRIRSEFDDRVVVYLIKNDFERDQVESVVELKYDGTELDTLLTDDYNKDELEKLL